MKCKYSKKDTDFYAKNRKYWLTYSITIIFAHQRAEVTEEHIN